MSDDRRCPCGNEGWDFRSCYDRKGDKCRRADMVKRWNAVKMAEGPHENPEPPTKMYAEFKDWMYEPEGYGIRIERTTPGEYKWAKTAWDIQEANKAEMQSEIDRLKDKCDRQATILQRAYPESGDGGHYFICGEGGEKDKNGLPDRVHVCPAFGASWFITYHKHL